MKICIYEQAQQASAAGAEIIAKVMKAQKKTILGLATGSTPVLMYKELIRMNKSGELDFSGVHTYNLDEYVGLPDTHEQSYRYFMNENLFDHVNIDKANTHVPCGTGADHGADAKHYDEMVEAAGGIDVQVLGIGNNGHIGFNEPAGVFIKGTHVVDLTESTIDANKRFFERREDVPKQAISMGVGNIMNAKKVILLAFGKGKAEAVRAMINGEIDPKVQASILQLHGDVTVLLDKEAASLL